MLFFALPANISGVKEPYFDAHLIAVSILLALQLIEKVSEYHRIIGFRNILIHGYDIIDEMIVWKAVENHLPILVKKIKEILDA